MRAGRRFAARRRFRHSSAPAPNQKSLSVPTRPALLQQRLLVSALLISLAAVAHAKDDSAPDCPVGVFHCAKKPVSFEMCGKNDLLDVYVAGLPTTGDRASAPRDASALKVHASDKTHYVLEGDAKIQQLDLFLHADKITYDSETTDFTTTGHVTYQDRGLLMSAASANPAASVPRATSVFMFVAPCRAAAHACA